MFGGFAEGRRRWRCAAVADESGCRCASRETGYAGFNSALTRRRGELFLSFDEFQRLIGAEDANVFVLPAKAMQMFVAGDDQIGLSGHSAGDDVVVIRVVRDHSWNVVAM